MSEQKGTLWKSDKLCATCGKELFTNGKILVCSNGRCAQWAKPIEIENKSTRWACKEAS